MYGLQLNVPNEVQVTSEEFNNFNIFELGSLLVNYKFVVDREDEDIILYTSESNIYELIEEFKIEELLGNSIYCNEEAEMHYVKVNKEHWFAELLTEKHAQCFLK